MPDLSRLQSLEDESQSENNFLLNAAEVFYKCKSVNVNSIWLFMPPTLLLRDIVQELLPSHGEIMYVIQTNRAL